MSSYHLNQIRLPLIKPREIEVIGKSVKWYEYLTEICAYRMGLVLVGVELK